MSKQFVVRLVMCLWYKEGTRRIMRPDELPFVVRRSICISKESSSRRTMRLVPVFILETHNQTNVLPSSSRALEPFKILTVPLTRADVSSFIVTFFLVHLCGILTGV